MHRDDRMVIVLTLGRWESNAILIIDRESATAAVVDPGEGAGEAVAAVLANLGVKLTTICLTHGHLDHLWAAPQLARDHDADVLLHRDDAWLWRQPAAAFGAGAEALAAMGVDWRIDRIEPRWLSGGEHIGVGAMDVRAIHTPGHTPGHVVYVLDGAADVPVVHAVRRCDGANFEALTVTITDPSVAAGDAGIETTSATAPTVLSGDLLFAGSVGRTDLVGGSTPQLFASLGQLFADHREDVLVIPGHGSSTTLGIERDGNPFVAEALSNVK